MRSTTVMAMILTSALLCGCTHTQLRWNTTHQVKTLSEIYEQQVLDNLAKFAHDANSTPSFAYPNQGGADVSDEGSAGSTTGWKLPGFDSQGISFGAKRAMKEAWTLTPVYDVRRLELMRCAYQQALLCSGLCSTSSSCPDCDKLQKTFYLGDPNGVYNAKTPNLPDSMLTFSMNSGRTTPGCFEAVQWLECGSKKCVPRNCDCLKVGHYCGTYVWIMPGGQNELTKLTFVILDYALSPQAGAKRTKDVTMYFDKHGNLVGDGADKAIEIKTTVPFDKAVPVSTIAELNVSPFDSSSIPGLDNLTSDQRTTVQTALTAKPGSDEEKLDLSFLKDAQKTKFNEQRAAYLKLLETQRRFEDLIGEPDEGPDLPPISTPPTSSFNPLQVELYRQTLTTPSP